MDRQPTMATTQVCAAGDTARRRAGVQVAAGVAGDTAIRDLGVFGSRYGMWKPSHNTVRPRGLPRGGTG